MLPLLGVAAVTSLRSASGVLPAQTLQQGWDRPGTLASLPSEGSEGKMFSATLADLMGEVPAFRLIMYCKDSCNRGTSKLLPHGLLV